MSGGSRRARGRRVARGRFDDAQVGGHSVGEVGIYATLAAGVAAVVLVAGGHPWWHAVAVIVAVAALIGVLSVVAARDDTPQDAHHDRNDSPTDQSGERVGEGRRSRRAAQGRRRRS